MSPTSRNLIKNQATLIAALRDPARWPGSPGSVRLIETHVSYVLLVGEYAYKFKKSLDLGFLNYSTLERRRFFCEEELRLNRRTAPDLYLEVFPVGGSADDPRPGDGAAPIEFAVKMRRFADEAVLDHKLDANTLLPRHVDQAVDAMVDLHIKAALAGSDAPFGEPEAVYRPIAENFAQIRALFERDQGEVLAPHEAWAEACFAQLRPALRARKAAGRIRECHGDLHLANLAEIDGRVVAFDAIEFNPQLRFIDVLSELAFLAMDLEARGCPALARRAVNRYLEQTGDYTGLAVLDFYKHYRAMVRAKVIAIRRRQSTSPAQRLALTERFGTYLALAGEYCRAKPPALLLTNGVSGTGKSILAAALTEQLERTVQIRSDVERKRLHGLAPLDNGAAAGAGIYTSQATDRTYTHLAELARAILGAGYSVIVDATFLEQVRRARFCALAKELGVPFLIVALDAPPEELRTRILARKTAGRDPSDADLAVLEHQLGRSESLGDGERACAITVDAGAGWDPAATAERIANEWMNRGCHP